MSIINRMSRNGRRIGKDGKFSAAENGEVIAKRWHGAGPIRQIGPTGFLESIRHGAGGF